MTKKIKKDKKILEFTQEISRVEGKSETPAKTHKEKIREAAERVMDKYAEAFQQLADGKSEFTPKEQIPVVSERKEVQKAFEKVIKKYSKALKKLADS